MEIPSKIKEQGLAINIVITPRDIELHCTTLKQLHRFIGSKMQMAEDALHELVDVYSSSSKDTQAATHDNNP